MIKNASFYDNESQKYTLKRYPHITKNFIQYYFKKRLSLLKNKMRRYVGVSENLKLIEIGCADGVVLHSISSEFSKLDSLVGIDISEGMIEVALKNSRDPREKFYLRDSYSINSNRFDIVIEVGVINLIDFRSEIEYLKSLTADNAVLFLSIGGKDSIHAKLNQSHKTDLLHLNRYSFYDEILTNNFDILDKTAYGLYIPKIWHIPTVGIYIQEFFEFCLKNIFPNLFMEKLYVLKVKS